MTRDTAGESDAELIQRSLADPRVFAVVFDRHYRSIHRYLIRRLGPDAGGELASETFLRAFDQRNRFDPSRESARPWLFGIAANLARMEARRRYRETRSLHLEPSPTLGGDFVVDLAIRVDAIDDAKRLGLYTFLEGLREEDRQILYFYALADLTQREIADVLGIPVGTVKSRLSRTRATLRELFDVERQSRNEGRENPHE